jgi:predicted O-methyltransferase YrrM
MKIPFASRNAQEALEATISKEIRPMLPPRRYDSFSRSLSLEEEEVLCRNWSGLLGTTVTASHVRYLANRTVEIERMCAGRLAGDLRDAVLRALIASGISGEALKILEIGTLFGVNAAVLYDVGRCFFERVEMMIIDPLDGYYDRGALDPATGLPVTTQIVRRNFEMTCVSPGDVEIVSDRSESIQAIKKAGERCFNLMFIDGDHSYEGVRSDFETYHSRLDQGGYLVFDNYLDGTSPGVDRFVDELRDQNGPYKCVGTVWRTAVFRRS